MPFIIMTTAGGKNDPIPYADRHIVMGWPHGICTIQSVPQPDMSKRYVVFDLSGKKLSWSHSINQAASEGLGLTCPAKEPSRCTCWQK